MDLHERIRTGLMAAADPVEADARFALENVLWRGRRFRRRTRTAVAASVAVLVTAGAWLAPAAWQALRGPGPGPDTIAPGRWEEGPAAEPGCVYRGSFNEASELKNSPRDCGVFPRTAAASGATAFRLDAVDGSTFWLVADDELGVDSLLAIPQVPVFAGEPPALVAAATTAPLPGEAADRPVRDHCLRQLGEPCVQIHREFRQLLPNGDYWELWIGSIGTKTVELHTVDLGTWTLEVFGIPLGTAEGSPSAESVIRNLEWSEGQDHALRIDSRDQLRAPLDLSAAQVRLVISLKSDGIQYPARVLQGCSGDGQQYGPGLTYEPKTGRARWCAGGRFLIEVAVPDRSTAGRFYASMTVTSSLEEPLSLPSPAPSPRRPDPPGWLRQAPAAT